VQSSVRVRYNMGGSITYVTICDPKGLLRDLSESRSNGSIFINGPRFTNEIPLIFDLLNRYCNYNSWCDYDVQCAVKEKVQDSRVREPNLGTRAKPQN
jgi:hypothetical protein